MCQQNNKNVVRAWCCFIRKTTDSTIFTTRLYKNLLVDKSKCIHCWTPPSWFYAVNRLETGSQGLIQTGFGFSNEMRNPTNPKRFRFVKWNTPLVCRTYPVTKMRKKYNWNIKNDEQRFPVSGLETWGQSNRQEQATVEQVEDMVYTKCNWCQRSLLVSVCLNKSWIHS